MISFSNLIINKIPRLNPWIGLRGKREQGERRVGGEGLFSMQNWARPRNAGICERISPCYCREQGRGGQREGARPGKGEVSRQRKKEKQDSETGKESREGRSM